MPGFTCINSYNPQSHLPRRQELSPVFYRWGNWGSKGLSKWPEDTKLTSSKAWIWTQTIWVKSHTACTAVYTGCVHWICNVYTGWNCKDPPLGLFMIERGGRKKKHKLWYTHTEILYNHEKWCYRKKKISVRI